MKRDAGGKQCVSVSNPNVERVRRWEKMMHHNASFSEDEHPRDKKGRFAERGLAFADNASRMKSRGRKEVRLPPKEYAKVMHELHTNLTKEERNEKYLVKHIGDYAYDIENHGFNDYLIVRKKRI
ncbi:hypothetical protein HNR45_000056 [Negativicoccus succinicivorans]|uniref:Uncharacterized protein n=1 Tax=Negativicoccus succinicivorans TaxID=620903 RepID=A0A841QWV9_9FIRM|nr:hypothetical protein [Negativicoccus succinicivorans]MBB6477034.1 hypothetical protein [Negativicoccus succinicivorans]